MDILSQIKKMQNQRNWTNKDLATHAKLTQSTITSMFNRSTLPTIPTLISLCEAFGITIAQFFAECDMPPGLTEDQTELLVHWSTLTDEQKNALILLMKCI